MGVGRAEVERWRWAGGRDAPAVRTRAIANAMKPARFTGKWQALKPAERRLTGVRALELADPAEEARSEEHTSELQSLMRISYAVFCLKKKKNTNNKHKNQ